MPISPRVAGFAFRAARAAKSAYCYWLNNQLQNNRDPINDLYRDFQNFVNNPPPIFPGAVVAATACDIDPPPITQDDFSGGQCECVVYTVEWEFREKFSEVVSGAFNLGGPIRGSAMRDVTDANGNTSREFFIRASLVGSDGSCTPAEVPVRIDPNLLWGRITRVTRVDGQPDDCGDREPPPPPPVSRRFPWTFDWEDENGTSKTTDVSIRIGDINLTLNNEIRFEVRMDLDMNVSLKFTFNGLGEVVNVKGPDIYLPGGGGSGSSDDDRTYRPPRGDSREGPQPDDFVPDSDSPPPPDSEIDLPEGSEGDDPPTEEDEEPEKIKVIRGVAVTVKTVRSKRPTVIFQDGNPDIYAPALGYINFRVKIGRNTTFWTNDIPVKNVKAFIPCPWEGGAVGVLGTPQPGVIWVLTPVYARSELPTLSF